MPELAEVQMLCNQLDTKLAGAKLEGLACLNPKWLLSGHASMIEGLKIKAVSRWGKRLRFDFEDSSCLVSGLGMTGNWLLSPPEKHLVASIETSKGPAYYQDSRKFGRAYIFSSLDEAKASIGARIGTDALAELDDQQLRSALGDGKVKLKAALLDQGRLSGIGNYLADEICFDAGLHPELALADLDLVQWEALNHSRVTVIKRALKAQGASFSDYRHADGSLGQMQQMMQVYGREGLPCNVCSAPIVKSTVAGRGTHHCPNCQPSGLGMRIMLSQKPML